MNGEVRSVYAKGTRIEYTFVRKRIKNIYIRVRDGGVILSAPPRFSVATADKFVAEHADFILKNLERRRKKSAAENTGLTFSDGDIITAFGKQYKLINVLGKSGVYIEGENIVISSPDVSPESQRRVFEKHVKKECISLFTALLKKYYPFFKRYVGDSIPVLSVRNMKTAWGTCIPSKRKITLNLRLYSKPIEGIEYVVVHEYCHFIELNHSPAFYAEVEKIMPDWKKSKKLL